ncbi:thiamine phosphate synthase [Xanthobacter variabilis]|uniref:thiamine phosphate synthase n=1 Tax=Xanthobacter variabilis TaxID=3119932 RepID=UPI00374F3CB4
MLPAPPVLLITDRRQVQGDVVEVVGAACAGGCRWVSLREKDLPPEDQLALFARLRTATSPFGAVLMLHGTPELAWAARADGVHLPDGADPRWARTVLGDSALVGLSTHRPADPAAAPAVADYITASPVFSTPSKPGYGPALGIAGLRAFVEQSAVPVIALGGIEVGNAKSCREAGAGGLAVMGGVMRATDPRAQMTALIDAFARQGA